MQLIDKDLLSMQEVRELVEAAKEAQQELEIGRASCRERV